MMETSEIYQKTEDSERELKKINCQPRIQYLAICS